MPEVPTRITQPGGLSTLVTTYTWSTDEQTLTVTKTGRPHIENQDTTTYTETTVFDARHRIASHNGPREDPTIDQTTYTYFADDDANLNRRGRLHTVTNPINHTTTYDDYDLYGTARSLVDPNGIITTAVTDARGRATTSMNHAVPGDQNESLDYTSTTTWDSRDRISATTSPGGQRTQFAYEPGTNHLLDTVRVDSNGNQIERRHLTLNDDGAITMEELQSCDTPAAPCSSWTTQYTQSRVYDNKGRLAEIHDSVPAGAFTKYTYNEDGLLWKVQDQNHTTGNTTYTYDELHRLHTVVQQLDAGTVTTTYEYDDGNNLASVTDPNGNVTTYTYDDFGRLIRQVSPVTGTTTYAYDGAGNVTSTTDENNVTTTRAYDQANRITSSTSVGSTTETTTWAYDEQTYRYTTGRLTTMTDPAGSTSYAYDRRGLPTLEARTVGTFTYDTGYGYNPDGLRSRITYPSNRQLNYTYDTSGRQASATLDGVIVATNATYKPFGALTDLTLGNGTTLARTYDQRYQIRQNILSSSGGYIGYYDYDYDGAGNITVILDRLDETYNRSFGYDDLSRLTSADTGTSLWGAGTYTYDNMGNLSSLTLQNQRTASFTYAGTTPKLTSVTEQVIGGNPVVTSVTYDNAGNQTQDTWTRTINPRNQTGRVTVGAGMNQTDYDYAYDGRGVRVITTKTPRLGQQLAQLSFYIPELRLLSKSGWYQPNIQQPATIAKDIIWFNGEPIAQASSTLPLRYTFTDHLGTPLLQTDDTARVIWQAEYEPYGNAYYRTGTATDQVLRLPGQETAEYADSTNEENYNIFRWYRSGWGRYTQSDPLLGKQFRLSRSIGGRRADPGSLHAYAYTDGNPLSYKDPVGLLKGPIGPLTRNALQICEQEAPSLAGRWIGRALGVIGMLLLPGDDLNPAEFENRIKKCSKCDEKGGIECELSGPPQPALPEEVGEPGLWECIYKCSDGTSFSIFTPNPSSCPGKLKKPGTPPATQ